MSETAQQSLLKTQPSLNGHASVSFLEHEEPIPVNVGKNRYVLQEMNDVALGKWMKLVGRRVVKDDAGKVIKEDYTGFHADLISLCLVDSGGIPVPKPLIQSWGAKTQNGLFELCQKLNGLSGDGRNKESEKNSEGTDTAGGSDE